jgi:hypothetical protein
MIRVSASSTLIHEGQDAMFMVTASPAPVQPVTVFYTTAGNASLGTDYILDGPLGQITIPAGATTAEIAVHALPGQAHTKPRTAKIQLTARSSYRLPKKAGKTATIKIAR